MTLPGGPAEKHGHHYEDLWTMWQFVRMLYGQVGAIRIEDPVLPKTEFWVRAGAHRELHQVKRQHAKGKWSIFGLGESLVRAIGDHLRQKHSRFVFASGSDAPQLRALTEAARDAESQTEFRTSFLAAEGREKDFQQLRRWWGCDVPTAIDFLRRIEVHCIDQRELKDKVRSALPALFLANVDTVVTMLGQIVDEAVHRTWRRQDLLAHLRRRGYPLRSVPSPENAVPAIESVTDAYLEAARSRLIRGNMLPRPTSAALLSHIRKDSTDAGSGTDNVITGAAGSGKTACVVDLADQLRAAGFTTLVFRLDRVPSTAWKTADLGAHLGLDESPALTLSAAAEATGQPGVLVVDQLDAVSAMSGRNPEALDLVSKLLREVRGTRERAAIHTILVCRTFDWKHDWRFKTLVPDGHGKTAVTDFTITEFTTEEVAGILADAGFGPALFQSRQLELLRLPQNLSIFLDAGFDPSRTPAFDTATKLFSRYWDEKRRRVRDRIPSRPDQWISVIDSLSEEMTRSQQLSVPQENLDEFQPDYLGSMVSEEVLTYDGHRYGFGHESFFDYCFARRFCAGRRSLSSFLTNSGQDLFRRAQVRQVLAYLRDADFDMYVRQLGELLANDGIRPHIKDLVLTLLAEVPDPTVAEWEVWKELTDPAVEAIAQGTSNHDALSQMAWRWLFASPSWFAFLDGEGVVSGWLKSGSDRLVELAVQYLQHHQSHSPDRVAAALEPYAEVGGDWVPRFRQIMIYATYGNSRPFVELFLGLLDNGVLDEACEPVSPFDSVYHDLVKSRPEWVPEVLAHRLRRRLDVILAAGDPVRRGSLIGYDEYATSALHVAADEAPDLVVEHLLPIVLDISDREAIDETTPRADAVWPRYPTRNPTGSREGGLLTGLTAALARLAKSGHSMLGDVIADLRRRNTYTANHILLALYASGGPRYADQAVSVLCEEPWRFECGYTDSPRWCAMELVRSVAAHCTARNRRKLEAMILSYRSPVESTPWGYKRQGRGRFDLLSAIPTELRSDIAHSHYRELERKFGRPTGPPTEIGRATIVGSPISSEATARMTDDQWLGAMNRYPSEFPSHSADALLKGGAVELSRELGARTSEDPDRFAQLALRIPADAHPTYIDEILGGLKEASISSDLKVSVCEKAFAESREYSGSTIADVIGRIEEPLPDSAIEMLTWLATESDDPAKQGRLAAHGFYTEGINTTRGRAVLALRQLILADATYIERFRSVVDRVIQDPSPAVLSCVAGLVAAIWRHESQLGLRLFGSMDLSDDRLLTTPHWDALLHYSLRKHLDVGRPLVQRMLRSQEADVRDAGGVLAGLASLYHEGAADLADEARNGDTSQRLGLAQVASRNISMPQCRKWCEENLAVLFNDDDASVRSRAAGCFQSIGDDPLDEYPELISQFCESRAFQDHADDLLRALKDSPHRLPGLTSDVCERILDRPSETGEGVRHLHDVANLVFRTYQHHQNSEWATRALSLIDRLCMAGDGSARRHLEEFER